MRSLSFKFRILSLIAAVILFSQPISRANAHCDNQWYCQISLDSLSSQCSVQFIKKSVIEKIISPIILINDNHHLQTKGKSTIAYSIDQVALSKNFNLALKFLLSKNQQKLNRDNLLCTHNYVKPSIYHANCKENLNNALIITESDESVYNQEKAVTLKGNVTVYQGNRQLKSDFVHLDSIRNYAKFKGNVVFHEPGILLVGDYGEIMFDTGQSTIKNASYIMYKSNVRGNSKKIIYHENSTMELEKASYTNCQSGKTGWLLSGKHVTLNPNIGFGTAQGAVIQVQGLPIFYAPYMYFAIDDRRQSGFLYPMFAKDSELGLDLTFPYYWNIAPHYDATITPRIISKRGVMMENEFRYLGASGNGKINIAGLIGKDKLVRRNPFYKENRWFFNIQYQQRLSDRWSVKLDYTDTSDKNYIKDFGANLKLKVTDPLDQKIETLYQGGSDIHHWTLNLNAHKFKNMNQKSDNLYNKLPQLVFSGNWKARKRLTVNYLVDYTWFSRANDWRYVEEIQHPDFNDVHVKKSIYDNGYGIKNAEGSRTYAQVGFSYPMEFFCGFLKPEVKIRSVNYNLNGLNKIEVLNDLIHAYGKNFNLHTYRDSSRDITGSVSVDSRLVLKRTNLFRKAYTAILEPRAKYFYTPYLKYQEYHPVFDTSSIDFSYSSLWKENRFSGYDRIADANQLSLGIITRLIKDDGFEVINFGIGQIIYFQDRQVYIAFSLGQQGIPVDDINKNYLTIDERLQSELIKSTSPLVSKFVYNFNHIMHIHQDFSWNTNHNRMDNYLLTYRWIPGQHKIVNMSFRYSNQIDQFIQNKDGKNILLRTNQNKNLMYTIAKNNLKQTDFSFVWPITKTNHWFGLGRWQYDMTNKRNIERLAGFEYNGFCYQFQFFWRSWLETNGNVELPNLKNGFFLQFVLHGLSNINSSSGTQYLQGIQGYKIREKS